MTLILGLIWAGSGLAVLGIAMLAWCIWRALVIRRNPDKTTGTAQMQRLIALNMAAVGVAFIGLAMVVVGVILA